MSTFEAFALRIDGGRTAAREAGGDHIGRSSPAGPSRQAPLCGRAAPEKTPADLGIFWVNGVNSGINGVNGGADGTNGGVNGRRPSARHASASDLVRDCDQASACFRMQIFASAGRPPGRRTAGCRNYGKSGGTCVGR
jgi:hypothetical protein